MTDTISLLISDDWQDYDLLDSGEGFKLERFGEVRLVRPEAQAIWKKTGPASLWQQADGTFIPSGEESGGHWAFQSSNPGKWRMQYHGIRFWVQSTPGRHLGVFPEYAAHWDWMNVIIKRASSPVKVLNLFGYTGLATLAAAQAGASVTHVDASKKSISWARENQSLSGLDDKPIRWILDDALKFVQREARRGAKYQGLIIDPPKFGRGPKGEVWEVYKSLPVLLQACRQILDGSALFVIITVYAVRASAIHLGTVLDEMMAELHGSREIGELLLREKSAGRLMSNAVFARWQK